MIDAKNELEQGSEMHIVIHLQADKLKILFLDSLVGQCQLVGVIQSVKMLNSILLPERRMQALELTIPACQVIESFSCSNV